MSGQGVSVIITATHDLQLVTNDGGVMVRAVPPTQGEVTWAQGVTTIPAREFLDLVARLEGPQVTLRRTTKHVVLDTTRGSFQFPPLLGVPTQELPSWNGGRYEDYQVDGGLLLQSLQTVRHAVSADPARPNLNAVAYQQESFVASDGLRLSVVSAPGFWPGLTIPAPALGALFRFLKQEVPSSQLFVQVTETAYIFRGNWGEITILRSAAQFPNVGPVLAQAEGSRAEVVVDPGHLGRVLSRVISTSDSSAALVRVDVGAGGLVLTTRSASGARAEEQVPVLRGADFPALRTYVSGSSLREALASWAHAAEVPLLFGATLHDRPAPVTLGTTAHREIILASHASF